MSHCLLKVNICYFYSALGRQAVISNSFAVGEGMVIVAARVYILGAIVAFFRCD